MLEDLANFKASTMVWFFCVRDWRIPGCEFVEFHAHPFLILFYALVCKIEFKKVLNLTF